MGDKALVVCGATERMELGQSEDKTGFVYLELTRKGLHHAEQVPIKPQPRDVITIRTTEPWPQQQPNTATPLNPSFLPESEDPVLSLKDRSTQRIVSRCTEQEMCD